MSIKIGCRYYYYRTCRGSRLRYNDYSYLLQFQLRSCDFVMIDEHYCISPVHLVPSRNLSFIRERLSGSSKGSFRASIGQLKVT